MHSFVYFDNRLIPAQNSLVSALSSAALYGKGIFTTIAVNNGRIFLWNKHWHRLRMHADKLKIDVSGFSNAGIRSSIEAVLQKNNVSNGRLRITFFDGSSSAIWGADSLNDTMLLIMTGDTRLVPDDFRLTGSPYTVNSLSPLASIKSCNYLDKIMALDEAKARGFDEAIQVNERGLLTSAVMANVFWLEGDRLCTSSLATGCLAGTTREYVLENLECDEVEAGVEALNEADAIFLTSAGLGVTQAAAFGPRTFEKADHPILTLVPR